MTQDTDLEWYIQAVLGRHREKLETYVRAGKISSSVAQGVLASLESSMRSIHGKRFDRPLF